MLQNLARFPGLIDKSVMRNNCNLCPAALEQQDLATV